MPLSFYRVLCEFYAKIQFNKSFSFVYTPEKSQAIIRSLNARESIIADSLSSLVEINHYLEQKGTAKELNLKASVNKMIARHRYEVEVMRSLKEDLVKNK